MPVTPLEVRLTGEQLRQQILTIYGTFGHDTINNLLTIDSRHCDKLSFSTGYAPKPMKTLLILALYGVVLSGPHAYAQYQPLPPSINVSGSAEVKVAPDEADLHVGVETRDAKLELAVQQNNTQIAAALAFLKTTGVPDKDVQTDTLDITPEYKKDISTTPTTFIVRKSIEVKLTHLETMESVLTGLLANGVNHIHRVEYRTSQLRKYRDQARLMATKAAKEKATAIVTELGEELGKVANITVNDYMYSQPRGYWSAYGSSGYNSTSNISQNVVQERGEGGTDSDGSTLSIGQISVSASVNVSFFLK